MKNHFRFKKIKTIYRKKWFCSREYEISNAAKTRVEINLASERKIHKIHHSEKKEGNSQKMYYL